MAADDQVRGGIAKLKEQAIKGRPAEFFADEILIKLDDPENRAFVELGDTIRTDRALGARRLDRLEAILDQAPALKSP